MSEESPGTRPFRRGYRKSLESSPARNHGQRTTDNSQLPDLSPLGAASSFSFRRHPSCFILGWYMGTRREARERAVQFLFQFDLNPPVVLAKGISNQPFFISWRSQRDVIQTLAWESVLYIWGGPILALTGLSLLVSRLLI